MQTKSGQKKFYFLKLWMIHIKAFCVFLHTLIVWSNKRKLQVTLNKIKVDMFNINAHKKFVKMQIRLLDINLISA